MTRGADPPSNAPSPGSPDTAAESSPSAASPASQVASRAPRLALLIATGFGLGYLPKAPGTWGSLGGAALAYLSWHYWNLGKILLELGVGIEFITRWTSVLVILNYLPLIIVALFGVWAANRVTRWKKVSDPQEIVVDEISGQLFALLIPMGYLKFWGPCMGIICPEEPSWKYVIPGFILFRVFDIWKPWPVRQAERLPGGWGIMADDWVAGIYAALCLWLLRAVGM